jgi:hypothetical protein
MGRVNLYLRRHGEFLVLTIEHATRGAAVFEQKEKKPARTALLSGAMVGYARDLRRAADRPPRGARARSPPSPRRSCDGNVIM